MDHTFVIGRMVHYALDVNSQNPGECRPAIITRIWSNAGESGAIQLTVFVDGDNDYPGSGAPGVRWITSVMKDKLGHLGDAIDRAACTPRSWHWPDECPHAD